MTRQVRSVVSTIANIQATTITGQRVRVNTWTRPSVSDVVPCRLVTVCAKTGLSQLQIHTANPKRPLGFADAVTSSA
jgi:hypothetical protein